MKLPIALIGPVLLVACAASGSAPERAAAPGTMSPHQIVAARQAAFNLTAATFGGMRATVESGGDVKPLAFGARGLSRWAEALPGSFPDGSGLPASRARAEIWQNRADFEARAGAFQSATAALAQAAQAGDAAGFKAAYQTVGQACSACHDSYRAEAK